LTKENRRVLHACVPAPIITDAGQISGLFAPHVVQAVADKLLGKQGAAELLEALRRDQLVEELESGSTAPIERLVDVYRGMVAETERMIKIAISRETDRGALRIALTRNAAMQEFNQSLTLVPRENRILIAELIKKLLVVSGVWVYTINPDQTWKFQYKSAGEDWESSLKVRGLPKTGSEKWFVNRLLFDLNDPSLSAEERAALLAQFEPYGCVFHRDEAWGYFYVPHRDACPFIPKVQVRADVGGKGVGEGAKGEDCYFFLMNKTTGKMDAYWVQNWRSKLPLFRDRDKDLETIHGMALGWRNASELIAVHHQIAAKNQQLDEMNQQLGALCRTDELTQIFNRREFDAQLEKEFARSARHNYPLSVLMIDIDNFKNVNDNEDCGGHDTGDKVLQLVAKTIQDSIRTADVAARWGGEEFAVILPDTDGGQKGEGAYALAERIRENIKALKIMVTDKRGQPQVLQVTISIGVATYPHNKVDDYQQLVRFADRALYMAKAEGRNRTVIYSWEG
jgi:diguanylate cyclase (GGDEF)-like protein